MRHAELVTVLRKRRYMVARTDPKTLEPVTIVDAMGHVAVWARYAPRRLAHAEFHLEYARA
jgi:ribulose 1,5-bisphosphate synthetase/thiazole synthase